MRTRLLLAVLTFVILLSVYAATLAPTITWRNHGDDGAELAVAAYTLGIAHPTGYPLYALLGNLFARLPVGGVAYRLNLMSAVFGAAAGVVACLAALELLPLVSTSSETPGLGAQAAAFAAAMLLGFSPIYWGQATIAEVYALQALLIALICWLGIRWIRASRESGEFLPARRWRPLNAMAFLFGLGLENHLTLLLLLPSAVLWLWGTRRPPARSIWTAGFFLGGGLLIYAYLPLRAAAHPALNWGDPEDWSGFWWLVSGQLYRSYLLAVPFGLLGERVGTWITWLIQQFTVFGFGAGIFGFSLLVRRAGQWAWPSLLYFGLVSLFALTYNTTDSSVYLIPAFWIFSLWVAGGLFGFLQFVAETPRLPLPRPWRVSASAVLVVVLLPSAVLVTRWAGQDLHADWSAYTYAQDALSSLNPNAVIIAETDEHLFSLWYFQYVEDKRPDVPIIAASLIDYPWYRDNLRRLYPDLTLRDTPDHTPRLWTFIQDNLYARTNPQGRAIFLTDPNPVVRAAFPLSPAGNLLRVEPLQ